MCWPAPDARTILTNDQCEAYGVAGANGFPMSRVQNARTELRRAHEEWLRRQPLLPADGKCRAQRDGGECGNTTFYHIEEGYEQWCNLELEFEPDEDNPVWRAYTNGWDDMTECGDFVFVRCDTCFTPYQPPKELEWN